MHRPKRSIVALIAAYAVALQALLLPLSVAAAGPFATALCADASTHGPSSNHQAGCPCVAGCGAQCCEAATLPPDVTVAAALRSSNPVGPTPALIAVKRAAERSPLLPRAPPLA
jgi:hypothetical protein